MRPSFGPNLPQTVTHICQKAIFRHALGIHKLDLIELYGQLGLCYFDLTRDDLDKDLQTFMDLGLSGVLT